MQIQTEMETDIKPLFKDLCYKVVDVDNAKRIVKAYFSAFGNVDFDGDIIIKGAFTKTIQEWGPNGKGMIRHLLNHDQKDLPLGKIIELGEDGHGGYFVSKMARTQKANDLYTMYQDGMINNHSMGFIIVKKSMQDKTRLIHEVKLVEVSTITTWSSNQETSTIDVKHTAVIQLDNTEKIKSLFLQPSRITDKQRADLKKLTELINF
jgi:HK97 family phage prohead protease